MEVRAPLSQAVRSAALSIEFVARPAEAHRLREAILTAVQDRLGQVPGFGGCLVMISEREARLVTVITFWTGAERTTCRSKKARCVHDLLTPYVDHCLRVQTLDAYLSVPGFVEGRVVKRESAAQVKTRSQESLCVVYQPRFSRTDMVEEGHL